jgi:hypothetical protein
MAQPYRIPVTKRVIERLTNDDDDEEEDDDDNGGDDDHR